jgi:hypothetical protein
MTSVLLRVEQTNDFDRKVVIASFFWAKTLAPANYVDDYRQNSPVRARVQVLANTHAHTHRLCLLTINDDLTL